MGLKIKCAWCGDEFDLNGEDANYYEDERMDWDDEGNFELWAKIQHSVSWCGDVNYVIFRGKLDEVKRRR